MAGRHVAGVLRSCSYHARALWQLTLDTANMVAHSIVSSRLDYANALLHGMSASNL